MLRAPADEVYYDEAGGRYFRRGLLFSGVACATYQDGTAASEVSYRHGLRWGTSRDWDQAGVLDVEATYHQDLLHGAEREWHGSGQLATENHYEYGVRLREREWDEAGNLLLDQRFDGGEQLAMLRERYGPEPTAPTAEDLAGRQRWLDRATAATASLRSEGLAVPAAEIGQGEDGRWYHRGELVTGTVEEQTTDGRTADGYRLGLLWGVSQGWRADRTLAYETHYQQGVKHGPSSGWYPAGPALAIPDDASVPTQLEGSAEYAYGVLVAQREWLPDGTLIEDYRIHPDDPDHAFVLAAAELPAV